MSNRRVKTSRPAKPFTTPSEVVGAESSAKKSVPPPGKGRVASIAKFAVGTALVVSIAIALAWVGHRYALTSPRFAITTIEITGNRRLSKASVEETVGVHVGDNLFRVSLDAAEAALAKNPWVSRGRVQRRLPGYLKIELVEEEAFGLLTLGGKTLLVSREGVPFKELEEGDPYDFPVVTGLTEQLFVDNRRGTIERLRETAVLLDDYARLPVAMALPVEEVRLEPGGETALVLGREGMELHLGKSPFKQKLLRAARVIGKAQADGGTPSAVFLDNIEHPERVVVRVR